jgi:putative component of membrane protein insertase Oxa1/YidC/SpoIIIJ protein YidD
VNHKTRILFYNAYILPHLDYCCSIWGDCSKYLLESLLKLQKRAARIILDEHDFKKTI